MAHLFPRPSLHVLTDPGLSRGRGHLEIVEAALAGGADVIQLRDKLLDEESLRAVAGKVADAVRRASRVFVVNDSVDVALTVGADGVHLGPDDEPVARARARWSRILGASGRTPDRARELVAAGADYLGVGPVYGTATKPDAPGVLGIDGLRAVVRSVAGAVPVIGIGGIRPDNAGAVLRAGAAGVAVISAVVAEEDVRAAVRSLREALDRARG